MSDLAASSLDLVKNKMRFRTKQLAFKEHGEVPRLEQSLERDWRVNYGEKK